MILGRSNIDFNTLPLGILYITSIPQILIVIGDHANMHVSFLHLFSLGRNIDTVNHYTGDHLLKSILGGYTFFPNQKQEFGSLLAEFPMNGT